MICLLDLGTSKISSILIKNESSTPEVIAFSSIETSGIKRGSIINISSTAKAILACINQIESQSNEKIKELHIGLSGEEISSTNSIGQVKISDREVTIRDIEKALNMSKTMNVPNDKTLLYAVPSEYLVDGKNGIVDPLGMNGVKLEARTHLIHFSKNTKENILKCIGQASNSLSVTNLYFNQLGVAEVVLSQEQKKLGVCLIDIGAGTTDISVYKNNSILFSKVLPYAGDYVTESIALSLDISSSEAEQIKKKYGCAFSDIATEDMLKINVSGSTQSISRKMLAGQIEHSFSKILRHCVSCLEENGLINHISGGFVLTGGSANLEGMVDLGETVTKSNFKIGLPENNLPEKSAKLLKPEFSALLGLAKFYALEQDKEFTFNQSKGIIARVLEWIRTEL